MFGSHFLSRRLLCQVHDLTAHGAVCQMRQHLLPLMRGQRLLSKSAKLVRIGVLAGLEELAHRESCLAECV
jgi:hypothetical protein